MHVRLQTYTTGTRVSDENLSQNQYESFEVEIFLEQQKATNFHMTKKYKKKDMRLHRFFKHMQVR